MNKSKVAIVITVLILVTSSKAIKLPKLSPEAVNGLSNCQLTGSKCSTDYLCTEVIGGENGMVQNMIDDKFMSVCKKKASAAPWACDIVLPIVRESTLQTITPLCKTYFKEIKKQIKEKANSKLPKKENTQTETA